MEPQNNTMRNILIAIAAVAIIGGGAVAIFSPSSDATEECTDVATPLSSPINSGEQAPY